MTFILIISIFHITTPHLLVTSYQWKQQSIQTLTKNELRVSSEEKIDQILVFDCAGRTIMELTEINDFTIPLNVTSFKAGFYHVKISHQNKAIQTKSFIKN